MSIHISSVYPPKLGGLEKVVQVLANTQKRMGQDLSVITSNQGEIDSGDIKDEVTVSRLKSFVFANTTIVPTLLPRLLRLKHDSTAHVHIAQAYVPEMVWLASKLKGFSYIAHIHLDVPPSGPAGFLLKPYKLLILKRVLRNAKFLIVFTEDQKAKVNKKYGIVPAKIKVIPNGVEDKFYYDKVRAMHERPRLLFVGRLGYQKNLQQLLHALDGISDQFEATLVGDGGQESELKELAKDLDLKNATFTGRKDGDGLMGYFKNSDIFVLPSEREGFGIVAVETNACGVPVLTADFPTNATKDLIMSGKNGYIFSPQPNEPAKIIQKTIQDAKKFESSSHKVANQYDWSTLSEQQSQVYAS